MGKSLFVERYQKSLRDEIESLFHNTWGLPTFEVKYEGANELLGKGWGDLTIMDTDVPNSILAIEIEHISNNAQPKRNVDKFKQWTHNSKYRKCGLLHIFNLECNLPVKRLYHLIEHAKINEHKGLGFFYETYFYEVSDNRQTRELAIATAQDLEFQLRLWQLLIQIGLVRN